VGITGRAHVTYSVGASLLPTVADGSNVFFMIGLKKVNGAEDIFVSIGASKGRAASVIGLGPDPFLFSALRERRDSLLPGHFRRVGLRGPYGGQKAA
jgi:hypothetical protein